MGEYELVLLHSAHDQQGDFCLCFLLFWFVLLQFADRPAAVGGKGLLDAEEADVRDGPRRRRADAHGRPPATTVWMWVWVFIS